MRLFFPAENPERRSLCLQVWALRTPSTVPGRGRSDSAGPSPPTPAAVWLWEGVGGGALPATHPSRPGPRGFGVTEHPGDPWQIRLAGFQKLLRGFCAKTYRMRSRASPGNAWYYDRPKKKEKKIGRGGKKAGKAHIAVNH